MTPPLTGQIAVVTGASRGIGLATADRLAAAGATVIRIARSLKPGSEPRFIDLPGDLADPATPERLGHTILTRYGTPDLLVNNAGVFDRIPLEQGTTEELTRQLQVNLIGAFGMLRALVPAMAATHGLVITVGSVADHTGFPQNSIYSATKYGLRGMHEALAAEYRESVRFSLVSPGPTDTPIWDLPDRPGVSPVRSRETMLKAEDVADAIVYVATRPARMHVELLRLMPSSVR
ncbi:MAG TPA: SDR family oxidoreductase [Gemmatimonadales bacterium]|nr:SDR family oxidoreductase [Gemmatimonadales bacterium]